MTTPNKACVSRLAVIYCCNQQFSKVVNFWPVDVAVGHTIVLEVTRNVSFELEVDNIILKGEPAGRQDKDAVFFSSDDENLFMALVDNLGVPENGCWVEGVLTD